MTENAGSGEPDTKKQKYSEWFQEKVEEVANKDITDALPDKLPDEMKGEIVAKLNNKPKTTPFSRFKKLHDA